MKTVFIKINNISEINTSKISVNDLNNRYIDKDGNMYGLKYNRKTRKVSIIRIIRTPAKSADYFNQLLISKKRGSKLNNIHTPKREIIREIPESTHEEELPFNLDLFINESIELMQTHKQRLAGIMMNIKNSRVIPERDRMESSQLNDLFRNLEIDGLQRIDKVLANYREIKQFPRSITYYISKLDTKSRNIIDGLDTDTRKMSFIYASEMYNAIKILYRTLLRILNDLQYFLDNTNPEEARDITNAERQYFNDGKISIENTHAEIENLLVKIKSLETYINDPSNF